MKGLLKNRLPQGNLCTAVGCRFYCDAKTGHTALVRLIDKIAVVVKDGRFLQ